MKRFEHGDACSSLDVLGVFTWLLVHNNETHSSMEYQEALAMTVVLVRVSTSVERMSPHTISIIVRGPGTFLSIQGRS